MLAAFNCGLTRPLSAGALHVPHDKILRAEDPSLIKQPAAA
jgi:hypothetical protein